MDNGHMLKWMKEDLQIKDNQIIFEDEDELPWEEDDED